MTNETNDPDWFEDVNEAFPQDNDYPVDRDDYPGALPAIPLTDPEVADE